MIGSSRPMVALLSEMVERSLIACQGRRYIPLRGSRLDPFAMAAPAGSAAARSGGFREWRKGTLGPRATDERRFRASRGHALGGGAPRGRGAPPAP
jgi:hypothetical protein